MRVILGVCMIFWKVWWNWVSIKYGLVVVNILGV